MFEVRVPPASVLHGEISGDESRENLIEFCVREERERERKEERKDSFCYHGSHGIGTRGCGEDKVVVGPGFWAARLSSEFLAARAPRAHSLRCRPVTSADTKNKNRFLVSADLINRYKKYVAEADLIS
jgi:hypothetical protein